MRNSPFPDRRETLGAPAQARWGSARLTAPGERGRGLGDPNPETRPGAGPDNHRRALRAERDRKRGLIGLLPRVRSTGSKLFLLIRTETPSAPA